MTVSPTVLQCMTFRTVVDGTVFSLQHRHSVRNPGVQHAFLLQVREADHEGIYPVPCEVCCERAFQTMFALGYVMLRCGSTTGARGLSCSYPCSTSTIATNVTAEVV